MSDVLSTPQFEWSINNGLSSNPSITLSDVLNNPQIEWNIINLYLNPSITLSDVVNSPQFEWDFRLLSSNSSKITMNDVLNNPQFNWDYNSCASKQYISCKCHLYESMLCVKDAYPQTPNDIIKYLAYFI